MKPPASDEKENTTQSSSAAVTRPPSPSILLDEQISAAMDQQPSHLASAKNFVGKLDKQQTFIAACNFLTNYQVLVTVYIFLTILINNSLIKDLNPVMFFLYHQEFKIYRIQKCFQRKVLSEPWELDSGLWIYLQAQRVIIPLYLVCLMTFYLNSGSKSLSKIGNRSSSPSSSGSSNNNF